MCWQLNLSKDQHKEIWKRKKFFESRFGVHMFSQYYEGRSCVLSVSSRTALNQDLFTILVRGDKSNFEALKEYVEEAFVHPKVVSSFSYEKDMKSILGSWVWLEILEELYSVYISIEQQSLSISGTSSSVQCTLSALLELTTKCNTHVEKHSVDHALESTELVLAVRLCKDVEVNVQNFQSFPKEVIALLMSWLKQVYKDKFPLHDADTVALDNSIVVLDVPDEKTSVPVIVLDSDNEHEPSSEDTDENYPPETTSKRKKKMHKNKKKKFLCDSDGEKKTSIAL